ncbi:MAG: hypothetical protein ABSE06_01250 [Anaerolineaceae bacterium]|jgi:hypothetical protein
MNPKTIILNEDVAIKLLGYTTATHLEFSGFGFCNVIGEDIIVYDFVLLHVGSPGYTEIPPQKVLALLDRPDAKNMKVWLHRHPVGNGIPGPHNWSGTDEHTCTKEPLGGVPEMVKWSVAVVITPRGWVGRIDNHLTHKTLHLPVLPAVKPFHTEIGELLPKVQTAWQEWEGWQGYQAAPNAVEPEIVDPRVLAVSVHFNEDDLAAMGFDRKDLEYWIQDDLEVYDGDPEQFVNTERAEMRYLIGE